MKCRSEKKSKILVCIIRVCIFVWVIPEVLKLGLGDCLTTLQCLHKQPVGCKRIHTLFIKD